MKNIMVNNQNDVYVYYEMIRQTKAQSVIDIGMLLKRAGAISRGVKDMMVSQDIILDGIDFLPQHHYNVLNTIYNNIYDKGYFNSEQNIQNYTLAFLMRPDMIMSEYEEQEIWKWARNHVKYIVTAVSYTHRGGDGV